MDVTPVTPNPEDGEACKDARTSGGAPGAGNPMPPGNLRSLGDARVEDVRTRVSRFPTPAPESDGTFTWDATVAVCALVSCGPVTGPGWTYSSVADRPGHGMRLREDAARCRMR